MYELRIKKNELREEYIAKRDLLDETVKAENDEKMCSLFTSLVTFRYADTVLLYVPMRNEINVLPIAQKAFEAGKKVGFPCCYPENRTMEFRIVGSLDELTEKDSYGIAEPSKECEIYDIQSNRTPAVCIVPAVVYDVKGYRIGYGRGYYDRYLSAFNGTKAGLIYSDFIIPQVPRGRYDLAVDVLITEKGVKALKKV